MKRPLVDKESCPPPPLRKVKTSDPLKPSKSPKYHSKVQTSKYHLKAKGVVIWEPFETQPSSMPVPSRKGKEKEVPLREVDL